MKKFFGFMMSFILIISGIIFTYLEKDTTAICVMIAVGVIVLIVTMNTKYFQNYKLKAVGLELEMQLRDKIVEVDKTLNVLKSVIRPLSEILIVLIAKTNRFANPFDKEKGLILIGELRKSLKNINCNNIEILQIEKEFHNMTIFDLTHPLIQGLQNIINEKEQEIMSKLTTSKIEEDFGSHLAVQNSRISLGNIIAKASENYFRLHCQLISFLNECNIFTEFDRDKYKNQYKDNIREVVSYEENYDKI